MIAWQNEVNSSLAVIRWSNPGLANPVKQGMDKAYRSFEEAQDLTRGGELLDARDFLAMQILDVNKPVREWLGQK